MTATAPPRPRMFPTISIFFVIALLGVVVWWNYYIKIKNDAVKGRLAMQGHVETDPAFFVDQNGKPRALEELKGKVVVWACVYTTCPAKCSAMSDKMKELQDEFGSHPKFRLVSICLYPEHDRPEVLKAWTQAKGFSGDNWLFLTGAKGTPEEGEALRKWLLKSLRFQTVKNSAEHIAKNPADVWTHDFVFTVSDGKANIRTPTNNVNFWHPFHPAFNDDWYPRPLREDIKKLLEEAEETP